MRTPNSGPNGMYAQILRALKRSRIRRDILKLLSEIYPETTYPMEIAREIRTTPSNVLEALRGISQYSRFFSLLSLGLVDIEEIKGQKYYRLSDKGLEIAHNLDGKL